MRVPRMWLVVLLVLCIVLALASYLLAQLVDPVSRSRYNTGTRLHGTGRGKAIGSLPGRGVVYGA